MEYLEAVPDGNPELAWAFSANPKSHAAIFETVEAASEVGREGGQ